MAVGGVLLFIVGWVLGWGLGYTQGQNRVMRETPKTPILQKTDFGEFIDRMMSEMRCQSANSLHFHCSVHRDNFDDGDDWDDTDGPVNDGIDEEFQDPDFWKKR